MKGKFQKFCLLLWNLIELRTVSIGMIRFLWNECPVEVIRMKNESEGTFYNQIVPCKPLYIVIGTHAKRKDIPMIMLHEVGHLKDCVRYGHKFNTMDKKTLEKSAWKWAIRFSEKYKIKLDWEKAVMYLATYDTNYLKMDNLSKSCNSQVKVVK